MDFFEIDGLGSKRLLEGNLKVNGAKNSVLKILSASFLFDSELVVENVPGLKDVEWLLDILTKMGVKSDYDKDAKRITLYPQSERSHEMDFDLARRLRSSIVLTGPALARLGKVRFPFPGGDKIGLRPIDIFIESFEKMGASATQDGDFVELKSNSLLRGAEIFFRRQSVTATEAVMMAAVFAQGTTTIKNAAMEPEVVHLAEFLNMSGARIKGAGTHTITVHGDPDASLKARDAFFVPADRIEAASFLALSLVLAKDVQISHCNPKEMEAVLEYYSYLGLNFDVGKDFLRIRSNKDAHDLKMQGFVTHEYPGFPTDAQAPTVAALTQLSGEALVFETIFEGRFAYTESLRLMGADILDLDVHRVLVKGPSRLHGRRLDSLDIRAGLAYIIATSVAEGKSKLEQIVHIDRGYENIEDRLSKIGVPIRRLSE